MDDEHNESVRVTTVDSSNFQLVTWSGRTGYSMSHFSDDINHQVFIFREKEGGGDRILQ